MNTRTLALALASTAAFASPAFAAEAVKEEAKESPLFLGAEFAIGSPKGEFAKHVDTSYGVDLHAGFRFASFLGLRFDVAHLVYGSETWKAMVPSFPGVSFEMNTRNTMTYFGVGPQLIGRLGPVRPFASVTAGAVHLATSTELKGNNKDMNVTEDTNFSDTTLAYAGGAGLLIPIPRWKGATFSLAAFYQGGGTAQYVLKGGLRNNGDGSVSPQTVESATGVLRYQVGLTIGL